MDEFGFAGGTAQIMASGSQNPVVAMMAQLMLQDMPQLNVAQATEVSGPTGGKQQGPAGGVER